MATKSKALKAKATRRAAKTKHTRRPTGHETQVIERKITTERETIYTPAANLEQAKLMVAVLESEIGKPVSDDRASQINAFVNLMYLYIGHCKRPKPGAVS